MTKAPNQKTVLKSLKNRHKEDWMRPREGAAKTSLDSGQWRDAANRLADKGKLEKKSEDTHVPYYPGVGVLDEGKKEEILRENNIPKEEWEETWRRWKKEAEEEGYWFSSKKVWFKRN